MTEDNYFRTYNKIYGPFKRYTEGPLKNKLDSRYWTNDAFRALADAQWEWSEKVDGTNIRIGWDGHDIQFGGRTDRAELPGPLREHLEDTFKEELFEQHFQDRSVVLFGEGYGGKIQKVGGMYGPDQKFILFDVWTGGYWLEKDNREAVAKALGIPVLETFEATLNEAMDYVTSGFYSRWNEEMIAEGLVGTPVGGLLDRRGQRIQVKVKSVDFYEE